jgi:uncharacterized paraquat-inducible protein A
VADKGKTAHHARANTLAGQQAGPGRLIAPLLAMALVALPISWHLPLFRTEWLVFLENDVTLLGAVRTLAATDLFLCAIVVLFGMAIPFMKLAALLYAWLAMPAETARAWIDAIGKVSKFAMLDVLLLALVIVGLKGVGMGKVSVAYGLYVYASVVMLVLLVSAWMQRCAAKRNPDAA